MKQFIVLLISLASLIPQSRGACAAERTLQEFVAAIDNLPRDQRTGQDPLTTIQDKAPAVRYFAIAALDAGKSKAHEQALVVALKDDVRWLRYAAAVKLSQTEVHAEKVAPILVEALGGDDSTFLMWGTRHVLQALYKVGPPALPHLAAAIDAPNEQLRNNACYVLGQVRWIVKDRQHDKRSLAALDAAIKNNRFPASRPMYVVTRMKIDGDVDRAAKLLLEDLQSSNVDVRVAALRQSEQLHSIADRFVPILTKALTDKEPKVIRAATNALWELDRAHDVDVSAVIPVIARQVEKKLEPYHLHNRLVRFLDYRWKGLAETPEEDLPDARVLVKNFPLDKAAYRAYVMQRLDRGLGSDDGIAASWVMQAHGAKGMAIIDMEFAGRSPAGKVLLMKAMQHLPYLESYELLLKAMADQETVKWNIPRGTKGSAPLPPGSSPLRVCDHAFQYFRWRLRDWKPLTDAIGRRCLTLGTKIAERDELIETMKKVWDSRGEEFVLPSYKMAQSGGSEQSLNAGDLKRIRQTVLDADVVSGTKRDPTGFPRQHLVIPEPLVAAYRKDPVGVLQVLRSVLKDGTAEQARKAYSFASGLFIHPTIGSKAAATQPAAYDQPIEQGGKSRRWIRVRQLENLIVTAAGRRMRPGFELEFLGYAPEKAFVPLKLEQLPESLQVSLMSRSLNLFQKTALPFAYNSGLYEPLPKQRDNDATIRVFAAETKGDKDLIELSWRVGDTDIKWVMGQNICCLMVPTATFDSSQEFETFLEKVYRMKDEPNWYQAYTIELPWPDSLRDGVEISSNINKHPAMDVFVWPLRLDVVVTNGTAHLLTYHRNPQLPGFEPGDAYFSDRFRKSIWNGKPSVGSRDKQ